MWFSVNHCSLSSGLSVEEAAASYALNRIKSYQVQMMSPVLLIHVSLTFIHASPRTNPVVRSRAKKCKTAGQCQTCQARRLRDYAEHNAQKHRWKSCATKLTMCKAGLCPENMLFSVNRCSLSWGSSAISEDEEGAASYALNRINPNAPWFARLFSIRFRKNLLSGFQPIAYSTSVKEPCQ